MKYLFAGCLILFISSVSYSQTNFENDYVFTSTQQVESMDSYKEALDDANWESYRLRNQRSVFVFDNGLTIELKSAVELLNAGYSINLNAYAENRPADYKSPVLTLLPGNR